MLILYSTDTAIEHTRSVYDNRTSVLLTRLTFLVMFNADGQENVRYFFFQKCDCRLY